MKKGDKVRYIGGHRKMTNGKEYEISHVDTRTTPYPIGVVTDTGELFWFREDQFELVALEPTKEEIIKFREAESKAVIQNEHPDSATLQNAREKIKGEMDALSKTIEILSGDEDTYEGNLPEQHGRLFAYKHCLSLLDEPKIK